MSTTSLTPATEIAEAMPTGNALPSEKTSRPMPRGLKVTLSLMLITVVGLYLATMLAPRLIGGTPLTISSTVMAPTLRPGDLAVVQPILPEALALGDVVAFHTYYEYLTAQRVVELVHGRDGSLTSLVTRVDSIYGEYYRVAANAVMGRIAFSLPMLGHVAAAPAGLWASALVGVLLPFALWHRSSFANR